MLVHYFKVNALSFFGNFIIVTAVIYLKATHEVSQSAIYRAVLVATIFLARTQFIFSLLSFSYLLAGSNRFTNNAKLTFILIPHFIFMFMLIFKYNDLLPIQLTVNILVAYHTFRWFKKSHGMS